MGIGREEVEERGKGEYVPEADITHHAWGDALESGLGQDGSRTA